MEPLVLDTNFQSVCTLDTFESFIWTDRFCGYGDFELYASMDESAFKYFQMQDFYLWSKDSEHQMIIEDFNLTSDVENGTHLKITGRSLESMLDRRIIWGQVSLSGNLQNAIQQLLNDNIISSTIVDRNIPNFIFEASTDPIITALTVNAQFYGANLYETIQKLCSSNNIGFKITLTNDNFFKFKLYSGVDRSYNQSVNQYVVFSPKFDNLDNSNYVESKKPSKTVTMVAGETKDSVRKVVSLADDSGGGHGLTRREVFTDASGVSSSVNGTTLSDAEYTAQLQQKGKETLSKNAVIQSFEGKAETKNTYVYGRDFFIGDIVQIANEYGLETTSRITEMIFSQSTSATEVYPTFAAPYPSTSE